MGVLLFVVPSITAHIYFLTKLALLTSFTATPTLSIMSTRGELSSHKVPLPKADQAHTASLFSEHQQRCVWCVHAHELKTAGAHGLEIAVWCTRTENTVWCTLIQALKAAVGVVDGDCMPWCAGFKSDSRAMSPSPLCPPLLQSLQIVRLLQ